MRRLSLKRFSMKSFFLWMIRFYRRELSRRKKHPSCRYIPTCSEYALQALKKYGPFKGTYLAVRRILRCHPFGGSGYDPVP